jgi:quinol monooxygenase YgiN
MTMYLRSTRGHFDPAKSNEATALLPDIVAAIERLPGCQGVQAGVDPTTGGTLSVSSFDTQEHAQFARESLGDAFARLQALGWQGEAPEIYETIA